jgi:hypothetical protein
MNTGSLLEVPIAGPGLGWAGLEIRRWPMLRRRRLTPIGEIDSLAVRDLADAIDDAERAGDTFWVELDAVTVVRRDALADLLALVG